MYTDKIEELAKQDGVLLKPELEKKLIELKSMNWQILESIIYVKYNQDCSLNDAKCIVVNSAAWIDKKEDFIKHQEEIQQEFLEYAVEDQMKQYNRLFFIRNE
jgi:hypothetical protein